MKRNMKSWLSCVLSTPQKGAMPILSFPAIQLMGITVKQLIGDSQKQSLGMQLVAKRAPSIASVSMMDLSKVLALSCAYRTMKFQLSSVVS